MAHIVKCLYCEKQFDADKEEFIKVNGRRYAHKACAESHADENVKRGIYKLEEQKKDTNNNDHRIFFDCINDICKGRCEVDWAIVSKEEKRLTKAGYTLSGLTKTFYYVYEIKQEPLPDRITMLFVLENYFEEAKDYYRNVYLTNKANEQKINIDNTPIIIETSIREYSKPIKFFDIGE